MKGVHRYLCFSLAWLFLSSMPATAGEITVSKAKRTLQFQHDGTTRNFRIGLGGRPIGPKARRGDLKTPEGVYFLTHKNPNSQFHLSLGISYPNLKDADAGREARLISSTEYRAIEQAFRRKQQPPQNTPLGGDIFIHGRGAHSDWTLGCIALDDADMEYLFNHTRVGDRITILP